jgi:hypothetical protein
VWNTSPSIALPAAGVKCKIEHSLEVTTKIQLIYKAAIPAHWVSLPERYSFFQTVILIMAEPNSSAPLLTSRGSNNGTQVLSTPNVRAADTNAANKAMGSSKDGQKPRKRKVSYYISPIVKSAAWIKAGWTKSTHAISRFWKRSWTAETCGFTLSVLCLGGLIATLLTHQNKPQPKWPRFITINAVVSLFSLLMRTGVSVVLSEGMSKQLRSTATGCACLTYGRN